MGFVVGATGLTGRHVAEVLVARGHGAVAHVRPDSPRLAEWRTRFEALGAELDVVCERPQDAMADIRGIEAVSEVALFGKGLHVVAADGKAAAAAIRHQLQAKGYRIDRIEPITPSLEDVFVSLVEARDRAQQTAEVEA